MAKSRLTKLQMNTLVELMSNDPKLSAGKFSENFTRKIAKARWEEIAIELNSLPGCEKSGDKWKKVWQDTIAKNKAATIKNHINGTGGGPATNLEMSKAQMDSIPLMSQVAMSGHLNSLDTSVTFNCVKPAEQTASYIYNGNAETTEEGMNSEQSMKKQSASEKLSDSNKAAWNMVDLASKKLNIKSNYYDQKLILLQQKNDIHKNIHTLLETYVQKKTRSRERKIRRSRDRGSKDVENDEVEEVPVTKSRDKDHESERKRKQRSCSRDRESKKDRKESDHHRRDKSKDRRDEHYRDNSERDDKIHTKQEPVDEYDNSYDNYYNDEYDNDYNSPHDDYDPYLVKNEEPDEENAYGSRYSNNAI
ncbi:uncharacterized protein DDB_G0283697-like [Acyrthosiphon pisum]|uniref:Regulatory protein zeste n=1 Tax=Acyrthosiphon pisum TaxID=7029 RepID=A0A8R2D2D4_ACYPI|nr:uncharacterized protein DDB_G0283697-like [Acyrthosiphon pisum]|eukprot:XP_008180786.2 PREDICTED: uncharacterized protein DDB_G0283697-like [Acyrthosiphon pisum]